jgi:hypothetical protein
MVTLVEAWASLKSFKRKEARAGQPPDDPGNHTVNFRGGRRSNAKHQSTTDPEAKLAKKGAGKEAKLYHSANALMENRNTILVDFQGEATDGVAERRAALAITDERLHGRRVSLWAATAITTRATLLRAVVRSQSPRTWHRTGRVRRLGARRAHRPPSRLRPQSAHPQASRGGLRLDEDGRRFAQDSLPRPGGCRCTPG